MCLRQAISDNHRQRQPARHRCDDGLLASRSRGGFPCEQDKSLKICRGTFWHSVKGRRERTASQAPKASTGSARLQDPCPPTHTRSQSGQGPPRSHNGHTRLQPHHVPRHSQLCVATGMGAVRRPHLPMTHAPGETRRGPCWRVTHRVISQQETQAGFPGSGSFFTGGRRLAETQRMDATPDTTGSRRGSRGHGLCPHVASGTDTREVTV